MRIELSKTDVEKILSTLEIEEIEAKLDTNYNIWNISCVASHPFILDKPDRMKKNE